MQGERQKERERERLRVFNPENKYGYKLNVNNDVLKQWYLAYMTKLNVHGAPNDEQRFEWEDKALKYIKSEYKKLYHEALEEPVIGWREQKTEELVRLLGGNNG